MHSHPIKLQPHSFITLTHLYSFRPHHCTMHPLSKHRRILQQTSRTWDIHSSSLSAAQNHDQKLHSTTRTICCTKSPKSQERHCSRRLITALHVTALTHRINRSDDTIIASLNIISLHKNKHFHMKTLTHNACGNNDDQPDKLSAGSTRQAAITFDTTDEATSNQPY